MEFKKTMDLFSSNNDTVLLELNKEPVSKLDLIKDIRDSVDGKNKNTLNMLYNVMNIKNVLESLNSSQNLLEKEDSRPNISSEFNEKDINTTEGNDNNNFDGFINMLNKIIDEKEMGE
jgi:flagellar biosynthesis chaperone FliJ